MKFARLRFLASIVIIFAFSACAGRAVSPELLKNARVTLEQGNHHQAYNELKELVDKYKLSYELVSLHVQAGLLAQDLEGLKKQYDGDSEWDLYGRGMWQAAIGDYMSSISSFQKALLINPKEPELYYRLAIAYLESGKYQEALEYFALAERYGVNSPKLPIRRAMAYAGLQKYDEAMAELVKGLTTELSREDLQKYIDYSFNIVNKRRNINQREMEAILPILGQLTTPDSDIDSVLVPLQNLMQRFPNSALLHAVLGLYYLKSHDDAKGNEAIDRAISYDPQDPYPPLILGEYLLEGQNPQAAMPYLKKAEAANPLDIRAAKSLLNCARSIGDRQTEQEMLLLLSRLDPLEIGYIKSLATYAQGEGKLELSASYYQKALQHDKHDLAALYGLAAISWEKARVAKTAAEKKEHIALARSYLKQLLADAPEHIQGLQLQKAIDNYQVN